MTLVGRLEDLPIADIVQIVTLSKGSGTLQLRLPQGRHAVMFRKGLMVNALSPIIPPLSVDLETRLNAGPLNRLIDPTVPIGVAALQKHLVTPLDLGKIIFQRVAMVVRPLCETRSGEFEFIAREPSLEEIEYDPDVVFRRGGIRSEDILGKRAEGLKALVAVKQSLKGAAERSVPPAAADTNPAPVARIPDRCVVVLEEHAATRDAIRHAAEVHWCAAIEARSAANVVALLDHKSFFIAVIGLGSDPETTAYPLIRDIKRVNSHLPVVVLDDTSDFRRRHRALESGADLYMRKPANDADEERSVFAEDLMTFVERRFADRGPSKSGEPMHRGFRLLVQLLREVTPGDVSQLSLTILQLAADYVDRGVLFANKGGRLVTLGKFGVRSNGCAPRLPLLDQVVATRHAFRGSVDLALAADLESAFGASSATEAIALPVLSGDDVVGVLYGDNGVNRRPIEDTSGLEIFLSQAGFALHNVTRAKPALDVNLVTRELQPVRV